MPSQGEGGADFSSTLLQERKSPGRGFQQIKSVLSGDTGPCKVYKQSVTYAIKLIAIQNHNEMSLHMHQMAVIKGQRVASVEDGVQDKEPVSSVDKNVD